MQSSNLFWTLIGVFGGGVVSLVITLVVQRLSTKKFISYEITTINVSANNKKDNYLYVNEKVVNASYISVVKISTRTKGMITADDFFPDRQLTLIDGDAPGKIYVIKNGYFQNANMNYRDWSEKRNGVPIGMKQISDEKALLEYDYIEKKRPLELIVFHEARLRVEGKLRDGVIKEKSGLIKKMKRVDILPLVFVTSMIIYLILNILSTLD